MRDFGRRAVMAAVGVVSVAGAAGADTVTAKLNGVDPARIVGVTYNGSALGQAYAGALQWAGDPSNGLGLNGAFATFCIDLTQDVHLGQTYTFGVADMTDAPNPLPPTAPIGATGMGLSNAQRVEKLYALEYDNIGADDDRGAAFQLAIWEMLFDTGSSHDVTAGMFQVNGASSSVVALANQFVSAATAPGAMTFHHQLLALTSATAQDQLVLGGPNLTDFTGPSDTPVVPTPATAMAALPLLGGLAICRKIKRRRDGL